jgi:hypothetical protein
MLIPRSHAWTPPQRYLLIGVAGIAVVAFGALVYSYERHYRGPSRAALVGTWQDMTPGMDSDIATYYRFKPDGTFDLLAGGTAGLSVTTTGTWYAGGPNIYWRFPAEFIGPTRPLIWHIDDISPNEVRVRSSRDGPVIIWKRVDLPIQPEASNQSMKPTAPFRNAFSVFATTPCRGLSPSR